MQQFNWADLLIIGIVLLSVVIGLFRGFVKEALSLAAWIVSFWLAFRYADAAAPFLADYISADNIRLVAAFVIILLVSLITCQILSFMLSQLVEKTGLSGTDRLLGTLFGFARGVLLIALLLVLGQFVAAPEKSWWQESLLIRQFDPLIIWLKDLLPEDFQTTVDEEVEQVVSGVF